MSDPLIRNVSDTAYMVAAYRAMESARPDALFHDPCAARLAGEQGRRIADGQGRLGAMAAWTVAVRTCIIDDYLAEAIAAGADTVLNLGAGLDARPYRMRLPPRLAWIEVDYPEMIGHKERVLAAERPACALTRVRLDLSHGEERRALLARIAARSARTIVLTEGVVPYLAEAEVAALADDLHAHAAFGHWIVDYFSPATYRYRERTPLKRRMANAPWRFAPPDYHGFFATHGWTAESIRYLGEEGRRRGRAPPWPRPLGWGLKLASALAPKAKREALLRHTGYVLFRRA